MKTIKTLILMLVIMASPLEASITRHTVTQAWKNITRADNFHELPINFENDSEPNAWVIFRDENNYSVHVTSGLMQLLESESEIAGVLGHEVGHVRLGHYNNDILLDTARIMMNTNSEKGDSLAAAVGNINLELRESSFSREQETEADEYGSKLLIKAGYDSLGLYNAMKRFADNGMLNDKNGFNSHPSGSARLAHLKELAGESREPDNESQGDNNIDSLAGILMNN